MKYPVVVVLRGGSRGSEVRVEIPYDEMGVIAAAIVATAVSSRVRGTATR